MAHPNSEDEILDLTRPADAGKVKPDMRVDPEMLRGSALGQSLPGFLERIARANQELDANGAGVGFELTDEEAASKQHIEMNVYAGVMKQSKKRRHSGIKLPIDNDNEDDGNSTDLSSGGSDAESVASEPKANNDEVVSSSESGEGNASSAIDTNQLAHSKKRKALSPSQPSVAKSPPRKIRIAAARASSPAMSAHSVSSSSSGSSVGSTRIIRLKVPSKSPEPEDSDGSSSSSPADRKIIMLRDPRNTPSPRLARQSTPSSLIKLKVSEVSPSEKESSARPQPSDPVPLSPGKRIRIKVVSPRN